MTNRRKRWLRRFAIGVSIAAFAAPAAAKPTLPGAAAVSRCMQSAILRPDDRVRSVHSRAAAAAREALRCGRTTARIGSRSRTARRRRRHRAAQAFPGMGPSRSDSARSCSSWLSGSGSLRPSAQSRRNLSSRGQRNGGGLFGARFRVVLGALGLARVEPFLEEDAQLLARREHVLVARPARGQLHDPNVVVPVAVTASVGRCFIERRQRRATAQEAHDWAYHEGRPAERSRAAVCAEKDEGPRGPRPSGAGDLEGMKRTPRLPHVLGQSLQRYSTGKQEIPGNRP